ncbi:MAG: dienelactone hydrolase family protein [Planctomycetes bacterium]|nr:dienelactone hydrolase family protein [Planctomycetota bacterium]MCW8135850.1 dienelactone hydrolase family protein [Planctomycetota bacterium]
MLVNPRTGPVKAGVVLIPKRLVADKAVMHSAQGIANTGFAVRVLELSRRPRTIDNVTLDEIVHGVQQVKQAARELRQTLGSGKKIGTVGAWLGGTLGLLASDEELDACVVVCPFVKLPVADDVIIKQPLEVVGKARAPILAVFGELDSEVPIEDVRELERVLSNSPLDDETYTYPGVGHAFFDNEEGNTEYREAAERDLWMRIDRFFAQRMF